MGGASSVEHSAVEGIVTLEREVRLQNMRESERVKEFLEGRAIPDLPPLDKLLFKAPKSNPKTYEGFWKCFDEYTDYQGGLSEESFTAIIQNVIGYYVIEKQKMDEILEIPYKAVKDAFDHYYRLFPGARQKVHDAVDKHKGKSRADDFMDSLPFLLPPITNAIHRFLDKDNNGSVSREEIEDAILLMIDFAIMGQKIWSIEDMTDHAVGNLRELLSDIFRFVGSSSHDSLSVDDSMTFITALLEMVSDGILTFLDKIDAEYIEPTKIDFMNELHKTIIETAPDEIRGPNGGISIQGWMDRINKNRPLKVTLFSTYNNYKQCSETLPSDILSLGQNFVEKFENEAVNKELPIKRVAIIAKELLVDILSKYGSSDIIMFIIASQGGHQRYLEFCGACFKIFKTTINPRFFISVFSAFIGAFQKLLGDMNGLDEITLMALEFFDVNNDGVITYDELFSLYDGYKKLIEIATNWPDPDNHEEIILKKKQFISQEQELQHACFRLISVRPDGEIKKEDLGRLFDKVVALIKQFLRFILRQFKDVVLEVLPALFTVLLQMKHDLLSRSFSSTSIEATISTDEIIEFIIRANVQAKAKNSRTEKDFSSVDNTEVLDEESRK